MDGNTHKVQQCFWQGGNLVIVTEDIRLELPRSEGIRALKTNSWSAPAASEGQPPPPPQPLFEPDDPRRLSLIQERISHLKD